MTKFDYIEDYRDNLLLRESFMDLSRKVFKINFEAWFKAGFWGSNYICHSFIDNRKIIANVSTTKLKVFINNLPVKALQIGTVMTHADYRGLGLAHQLMTKVINKYQEQVDLIYLFPDKNAISFYQQFNFHLMHDFRYSIVVDKANCTSCNVKKLDMDNKNDLNLLVEHVNSKAPLSPLFSVTEAETINFFHYLSWLKEHIYLIQPENYVVIFQQVNNTIELYDVITSEPLSLNDLLKNIPMIEVDKVIFHFTPSFKDLDDSLIHKENKQDLFVKPPGYFQDLIFCYPTVAQA